jgi:hypothetical protein
MMMTFDRDFIRLCLLGLWLGPGCVFSSHAFENDLIVDPPIETLVQSLHNVVAKNWPYEGVEGGAIRALEIQKLETVQDLIPPPERRHPKPIVYLAQVLIHAEWNGYDQAMVIALELADGHWNTIFAYVGGGKFGGVEYHLVDAGFTVHSLPWLSPREQYRMKMLVIEDAASGNATSANRLVLCQYLPETKSITRVFDKDIYLTGSGNLTPDKWFKATYSFDESTRRRDPKDLIITTEFDFHEVAPGKYEHRRKRTTTYRWDGGRYIELQSSEVDVNPESSQLLGSSW